LRDQQLVELRHRRAILSYGIGIRLHRRAGARDRSCEPHT
jgi:hypothetical protein